MRRRLTCLALPLIAALALGAAAPLQAQPQGELRIGVEAAYPPFSELGPDGQLKGFDIDIAKALCAQLKLRCRLVQTEFDAMIPSLRAKKIDAVVASMSITAERQKAVDFSRVYYNSGNRFIGRAADRWDITPAGTQGRRIGVQRNTINDRYVTAVFKGAQVVRYARQDEAYLDLLSGRVDGVVVDAIAGSLGFLKTPQGKGYAFRGPVFDDPAYFGLGAGIAVRKGNTELRDRIDAALDAMLASGEHKRLQAKYFDIDVTPPR
jgi:arginine/ornithine transport system substrate-binding protein